MRSSAAIFLPLSLLVAVAACSSTTIIKEGPGSDAGTGIDDTDAGETVADAGVIKDSGAAKKDAGPAVSNPQAVPPVQYNGGSLILAPVMVSVTVTGDPLVSQIENFDDTIGTTPWWDAVRAGFCDSKNNCIGKATAGQHIHLASVASSYSDSAGGGASTLQTFITTNITNGTFPVPTGNTLYMIYFPSSTSVSLDGAMSCQEFGGYHNSMKYNGTEFAYAIMPRCPGGIDQLTTAASHELAEAATDPFISTDPNNPYTGYGAIDDAWDVPAGGEVGDRCFDILGGGNDQYQQGSFAVQRIFNNNAANGKHDPCVPAPSPSTTPYFNMAPLASAGDVITMTAGTSTTIQVQAIADAPIAGQIAFDAMEITNQTGKGSDVLTLTGGGGVAIGQKANLTIKLNSTPSQGLAIFVVRSSRVDSGGNPTGAIHYWPFVVQTQ